jgi:hypothetical protein
MVEKAKMANSLTPFERETTINWNRQDDYATIDTRDGTVINRLERMGLKPIKVREGINTGELLGKLYHVPVKWVRLPRIPTKRNFTDEQKAAASERMRNQRLKNKAADIR